MLFGADVHLPNPALRTRDLSYVAPSNNSMLQVMNQIWGAQKSYRAVQPFIEEGALAAVRGEGVRPFTAADAHLFDNMLKNSPSPWAAMAFRNQYFEHAMEGARAQNAARRLGGEFAAMMAHEPAADQNMYRGFMTSADKAAGWAEGTELSIKRPTSFTTKEETAEKFAIGRFGKPGWQWWWKDFMENPEGFHPVTFEVAPGARHAEIEAEGQANWQESIMMGDFGVTGRKTSAIDATYLQPNSGEEAMNEQMYNLLTKTGGGDYPYQIPYTRIQLEQLGLNPTHFQQGGVVGFAGGGEVGDAGASNQLVERVLYNRSYAEDSATDYQTKLTPQQETQFRAWVTQTKVYFDPDADRSRAVTCAAIGVWQ